MTLDYGLFIFLGIVFAVGIIAFLFYAYKKWVRKCKAKYLANQNRANPNRTNPKYAILDSRKKARNASAYLLLCG